MIASWMAYASLIGGCAAIVALALEPLARSRGWATRWIWAGALAASFLVPVAMAVRPIARAAERLPISAGRGTPAPELMEVSAVAAPSVDAVLGVAWIAATLVMLVIVLSSVSHVRRSRRSGERAEIGGEAVALTTNTGPGAVWFGEPRIVMPRWVRSLDEGEAELLVRHEREHVRASDPELLAAALGALVAAPWNAPVWFIARRLRAAIEIDCDARVLADRGDVRRYGELLIAVAARRNGRPLAALLPFAEAATSLERRIRAMTDRRTPLSAPRRMAAAALALAALGAACEARRPEPLAPVSTYSIENGKATATPELSSMQNDSVRAALGAELRMKVPDTVLAGRPTDPVVMVYDGQGVLLYSARLRTDAIGGDNFPVNAEAIETVDVMKRSSALPEAAKGGVIRVTLKEGAERVSGTWVAGGAAPRSRARVEEKAPIDASTLILVFDAEGTERQRLRGEDSMKRISPELIERIDVEKRSELLSEGEKGAIVRIYLKPGAKIGS